MAKQTTKQPLEQTGGIQKKDFSDLKKITSKFSSVAKFKPQEYFTIDEAFYEATGLPGPAKGHINMYLGHSDTGKSQPLSSKILTKNGWTTMGKISIGNEIMGINGNVQTVLQIFPQGIRPVYKVTMSDGGVTYCDEEHLWSVNEYKNRHKWTKQSGKRFKDSDYPFKTVKLKDMLNNLELKCGDYNTCNYMIPHNEPMKFVDESDLPINPYILGCFLGDGYYSKRSTVQISNNDIELAEKIIEDLGVNKKSDKKFIPYEYIYRATIEDRIQLLQGLMDTDGYCDTRGVIEYTTISEQLKDSVSDLVRSLGGVVRVRSKTPTYTYLGIKKEGKLCYTISITLPSNIEPFYLTRKKDRLNPNRGKTLVGRYIKSIEYSHDEECQCILVSNPDHLYITDDYIVTHNTTAMVKAAVSVQKQGGIPVFIITEQKWSWEHARIMGLQFQETIDEATGEVDYDGQFIFNNTFNTIEDISDYMNGMLDEQGKGNLPYELTFLWDSIGSVPCRMTFEGKGGKMHNAGVLADVIGMGLNNRITGSRIIDSKYTNTLIIVNQPWVKTDMKNPMSQPKIKAKGGEAVYLNSTLVFQFGNQQDAGISKLDAQKQGRKIVFSTRSKVSVIKNHINGLGYSDGRLLVTPHGFIMDDPDSIKKYKTEHSDYWQIMLGDGDFSLSESEVVKNVTAQTDED